MTAAKKKSAAVPLKVGINALMRALERARSHNRAPVVNPFSPALHPPQVTPALASKERLAMDDTGTWANSGLGFNNFIRESYAAGAYFMGYGALAVLAQLAEYRIISETIASEMTRRWVKFQSKHTEADNTKRLKELKLFVDDLGVREVVCQAITQDGLYGRGHVYLDTGKTDDRAELIKSLGNGRDKMSERKVSKEKPLLALRAVEAVWCYPTTYNSDDPLNEHWYRPETWLVMGKRIHRSRLLTVIGREVPDLLKPAYSFGGLSVTQLAKPTIDNWLRTRQSISDIINSFSVFVLMTELSSQLGAGGDEMFRRADLFNILRDNMGLLMIDKNTEDFKNISAPLGTLDQLQAQAQEHIAAVARMPVVKLTGIQPAGLNADSEGVLRSWEEWVHSQQEKDLRPLLTSIFGFCQLSLWGKIDPDITFRFLPLREMTDVEEAETRKVEAETHSIYIEDGVIDRAEVRVAVGSDEDSPYSGIDVDDLPEMPAQGEEGGDIDIQGAAEKGAKKGARKGAQKAGQKSVKNKAARKNRR